MLQNALRGLQKRCKFIQGDIISHNFDYDYYYCCSCCCYDDDNNDDYLFLFFSVLLFFFFFLCLWSFFSKKVTSTLKQSYTRKTTENVGNLDLNFCPQLTSPALKQKGKSIQFNYICISLIQHFTFYNENRTSFAIPWFHNIQTRFFALFCLL